MLDKLVSSSDQILPTTGFWGFLLNNWLAVAIVVMVLGFAIDQTLYVIRYRPQDRWRQHYEAFRAFLTHRFGVAPLAPQPDRGPTGEGPVIRRAGAQLRPETPNEASASEGQTVQAVHRAAPPPPLSVEEPEVFQPAPRRGGFGQEAEALRPTQPRRPAAPLQDLPLQDAEPEDADAPVVVRAPEGEHREQNEEPITLRPNRPQ